MNYKESKLITFFSSQYSNSNTSANENGVFSLAKKNFSLFYNIGATGYIIIPNNNYHEEIVDDVVEIYGISNLINSDGSLTTKATDCIDEIKDFIDEILKIDNDPKLWIGTPMITSTNFGVLNSVSAVSNFLSGYKLYVEKLQSTLGNTWQYVQGIYYNQESIYGGSNDDWKTMFTDTSSILYLQYKLMNDFSYYVHSALSKDLIWIPYLPYKEMDDFSHEELFKRIGMIIRNTTCFDCAYIQPHITPLYGEVDYPATITDEFKTRFAYGKQNAETITADAEDQEFYYRDKETPVISDNIDRSGWDRVTLIGGEYELAADSEEEINKTELNKSRNYESTSLFRHYSCFDSLVGERPIAFYWQSMGHLDLVSDTINYIFNRRYCDTTWTTSKTDSNAEVETDINVDAGSRTKTDVTYTSDLKICEGDIIQVSMTLGLNISNQPSTDWETSEDYNVEINGLIFNIAATAGEQDGDRYYIYNGNRQTSDDGYTTVITKKASSSMVGKNLYTTLYLPYMYVNGSSMGYYFSFNVWVNGRQVL